MSPTHQGVGHRFNVTRTTERQDNDRFHERIIIVTANGRFLSNFISSIFYPFRF